jgi:hypothetical protein
VMHMILSPPCCYDALYVLKTGRASLISHTPQPRKIHSDRALGGHLQRGSPMYFVIGNGEMGKDTRESPLLLFWMSASASTYGQDQALKEGKESRRRRI